MNKEQLDNIFKDVDESKKQVVQSMFDDFIYEHKQLEMLKPQLEEIGVPRSEIQAKKKRYLTKEYVDISQRHDSKIKIFLSVLGKYEAAEENPLAAWIKERSKQ